MFDVPSEIQETSHECYDLSPNSNKLITDLTSSTEIEHFQTTLDRRSILTVHRSANCHPAVANYVAFNGSMMRELAVEFLSLAGALARRSRGC
jgi:hypothetical protein